MNHKCKLLGHKWDEEGEYKQCCKRKKCTAYRTLMENKYPKIGEPKYEWKIVDFDKIILR